MAVSRTLSRAERRAGRTARVVEVLGPGNAAAGLDVLELTEFAWHDVYQEIAPPDEVIEDILTCSKGDLAVFVRAARLAVTDFRDLRLAAEAIRNEAT